MAIGTSAPCHCAHASFEHALIRCGCTNDRPHSHHEDPMKDADDAFHRVWCCTCGTYCSKDAHCPLPLPQLQASSGTAVQKNLRPLLIRLPLRILSLPMCTCLAIFTSLCSLLLEPLLVLFLLCSALLESPSLTCGNAAISLPDLWSSIRSWLGSFVKRAPVWSNQEKAGKAQ